MNEAVSVDLPINGEKHRHLVTSAPWTTRNKAIKTARSHTPHPQTLLP